MIQSNPIIYYILYIIYYILYIIYIYIKLIILMMIIIAINITSYVRHKHNHIHNNCIASGSTHQKFLKLQEMMPFLVCGKHMSDSSGTTVDWHLQQGCSTGTLSKGMINWMITLSTIVGLQSTIHTSWMQKCSISISITLLHKKITWCHSWM